MASSSQPSGFAFKFNGRRSAVLSRNGIVASAQPLATRIGVQILKNGGNAADAAVAVAAAMNVTQPTSTGIGGDCFCLFYDAKTKRVRGLNGSGRAPNRLTLNLLHSEGYKASSTLHNFSAHAVTVPGAAAGWVDTIETFGSQKLFLADILKPAIELAEYGYPVSHLVAHLWSANSPSLQREENIHGHEMLLDGMPPHEGDIMRMPHLANTFKELAQYGKDGFYKGRVAKAIVDVIQEQGGVMTLDDLAAHHSTLDKPIRTNYRGIDVWEMPPNGQGITALMALNILEGFDLKAMGHNSADYLHTVAQALGLSFADTIWFNADPSKVDIPITELLSKEYAAKRRQLINRDRTLEVFPRGSPHMGNDTVYFTVVDKDGNACSFINSNYMNFGTGLVPQGCGFTLQNRGCNFSLQADHPNVLAPGKRPYHTIIPGMATCGDTGNLYASFGVMGGFMQPQGHVQVLANMIDFDMDPQQALDMPRLYIDPGDPRTILVEDGIPPCTIKALENKGHVVRGPAKGYVRTLFGRGQVIMKRKGRLSEGGQGTVYWAGSDGRGDGLAIGY